MRPLSRPCAATACAAVLALLAAAPAAAQAPAPPPNDNYLASTTILDAEGAFPREYRDTVDTTAATTQADLFEPDREGNPLGGAGPEPTRCEETGATYGKTVWWDLQPPVSGGAELRVSGFDAVVAVHEWNARTSLITRTVVCVDDSQGTAETVVLPELRGGTNYTVQVGGRAGAGGPLTFDMTFFADTDEDGILDELPDKCPRVKGIDAAGGCPPPLRTSPTIAYDNVAGGISVTRLQLGRVPKGARVDVRAGGVRERVRARRTGRVTLRRIRGTTVRPGSSIQVRVTLGSRGKGRYRHGAIGNYFRWPVTSSGLGVRVERCLPVGSSKPRRRCT